MGADTDDRGSGDGSNWRRRDRRSSMDKEALVSHQVKVRFLKAPDYVLPW